MDGNENEYEHTWLYHRGHWELVNDPIVPEEPGETYQDYLDLLGKYGSGLLRAIFPDVIQTGPADGGFMAGKGIARTGFRMPERLPLRPHGRVDVPRCFL